MLQGKITKVGNSLGIRLPAIVLKEHGWSENDKYVLEVTNEKILLIRVIKEKNTKKPAPDPDKGMVLDSPYDVHEIPASHSVGDK